MGTAMHGISPDADRQTGGAAYWFARVRKGPRAHEVSIVWDPGTLLRRADWFFPKGDHFGATNPSDHRATKWITDPEKVLQNPSAGNEITFKDGVGMSRPFAPREIRVPQDKRDEILAWCQENGIGEIGGRAVGEVVAGWWGGGGQPNPIARPWRTHGRPGAGRTPPKYVEGFWSV